VIEQDCRQIVHHERRDDLVGAFLTDIAPPDPLRLDPPGIEISLAALYESVPIAAGQAAPALSPLTLVAALEQAVRAGRA
jgi:hypothetical protein